MVINGERLADIFPEIIRTVLTKAHLDLAGYGLAIVDRQSGAILAEGYHHPDHSFYPASSIKTLIAMAALKKVDEGQGKLGDRLQITQPNADQECSEWDCEIYGQGKFRTVEELIRDTLVDSNNISTNQLIDWVSKEEINKIAQTIGADSLRIVRKLYSTVPVEPELEERNEASVRGLVRLYVEILLGKSQILSESSRTQLIQYLGNTRHNDRLNAALPGIPFFHKTGSTSDSSSDAGFFYLDDRHALVLVGLQDFRDFEILKEIGKQVWLQCL